MENLDIFDSPISSTNTTQSNNDENIMTSQYTSTNFSKNFHEDIREENKDQLHVPLWCEV